MLPPISHRPRLSIGQSTHCVHNPVWRCTLHVYERVPLAVQGGWPFCTLPLCPDTLVHPLVLLLQRPNCPFPPSCLSLGVLVTFLNLGFLRAWSCDYYHVCGPSPAQSQAQRWSRKPVGEGRGSTGSCLHGLQSWRNLAGRPKLKSHLHRTSGASLKGRESPVGTGLQGQHAGRWT